MKERLHDYMLRKSLPIEGARFYSHRLPALKRMFIREAAGLTGEVPKLLRGEAL